MKRHTILFFLLTCVTLLLATSGCVRRRWTIQSNPAGATVFVDKEEFGKTPITGNFQYYGLREVTLVKEGYETKTVMVDLKTPWYQWPGLDFFSEVLIPGEITDSHQTTVAMEPQRMVSDEELLGRANELRSRSHASGGLRMSSSPPVIQMSNTSPLFPPP